MLEPSVSTLFGLNPRAQPMDVRTHLAPICKRTLSATFLQRVKQECMSVLYDAAIVDNVCKLPAVVAALEEKGWTATIIAKTAFEMQKVLLRIAYNEHQHRVKNTPASSPSPLFDLDSVLRVEKGCEYVWAYVLSPPFAAEMHFLCHKYSASDFAHCAGHGEAGGGSGGVIGSRCFLDSNRHVLPLVQVRVLGNEDKVAWKLLNDWSVKVAPGFDKPGQVDACDGDKGAAAASKEFKDAVLFRDLKHRKDNLMKGSSVARRSLPHYLACFFAASKAAISDLKSKMPDDVRIFLNKIPDENQYPAANGGLRGRKGSSFCESINRTMRGDEREARFTASLLLMAQNVAKRFKKAADNAAKETALVPQRVNVDMQPARQQASRIAPDLVSIEASGDSAVVMTTVRRSTAHRVIFSEIAKSSILGCDNGCLQLTAYPCRHCIAAAAKMDKAIEEYMHAADTTKGWKAMYAGKEIQVRFYQRVVSSS